VGGEIIVGAVYVPMRGELFTAVRGEGAWLESARNASAPARGADGMSDSNSESDIPEISTFARSRLRCGPGVPLDRALVATGFGYLADRRKAQGEVVAGLLPMIRDIRRNGAASRPA
jgi:myo-inositol-1(or 4)-monophosphatase